MSGWHNDFFAYLRKNPGSEFILVFIFSLGACAFLLVHGQEKIAEQVGNCAYLFLVIGTVINLVQFLGKWKD